MIQCELAQRLWSDRRAKFKERNRSFITEVVTNRRKGKKIDETSFFDERKLNFEIENDFSSSHSS